MVSGCASTRYVNGTLESNGLTIPKSEFTYLKKDKPVYREFIIISHDKLEFPIYVFSVFVCSVSHINCLCSAAENMRVAASHGKSI